MFRNSIWMTIRLGLVGTAVALAAVVGVASSAAAYQTGYGAVQLVSMLDVSAPACTGSDAAAIMTHASWPQYPQTALEQGVEGTSIVTFAMALDGSVSHATIAGTSGNILFDRAALDAVKKSQFAPATCDGSKIAGVYGIRVVFAKGDAPALPALAPFAAGGGRVYPQ